MNEKEISNKIRKRKHEKAAKKKNVTVNGPKKNHQLLDKFDPVGFKITNQSNLIILGRIGLRFFIQRLSNFSCNCQRFTRSRFYTANGYTTPFSGSFHSWPGHCWSGQNGKWQNFGTTYSGIH